MKVMRTLRILALITLLPALALHAQKKPQKDLSGYDKAARATVLHTANLYVTPDTSTPPMATVTPGHEVVVLQHNGAWVNVFANTDEKEDADSKPEYEDPGTNPDPSSGWIRDKGIVGPQTPHGDLLIYGAAAELEAQAMQPSPPKGAAEAAHFLYARVSDYFPTSPLAAESAFRAADIRWQLEKLDNSTLPSAHEANNYLRPQLYEDDLKRVMKNYPESPFAARAAFDLLDNKLCGDWQGLPKCPEQEVILYMKYADRYPNGPKSAEALLQRGVPRRRARDDVHGGRESQAPPTPRRKPANRSPTRCARCIRSPDYTARAASIAFRVAQGIGGVRQRQGIKRV